jgi:hypothetical protein
VAVGHGVRLTESGQVSAPIKDPAIALASPLVRNLSVAAIVAAMRFWRFSKAAVFNTKALMPLVGPGGLEPPTKRL